MLDNPSYSLTPRRKSMDPVSQYIHLEELPTPGSRFELQDLIGIGTCGKVYTAMDKQKGCKVAVKIIDNIAENLLEIESEHRVLTSVGGQSLIPEFHGTYLYTDKSGKKHIWFVMEFCDGVPVSDLLRCLQKNNSSLSEEEIAVFLRAFMMAIYHLHENDIIHRDIRSSNFILSPEGDIKIIDFGSCALVKDSDGKTQSSVGCPNWMAPEVIACEQMRPYSKSCDIYSLGITAIELAETQPPLSEIHPMRAMFQIARNPPPTLQKLSNWSENFKDFIHECLERNAEHRPCVLELMLHPFVAAADDPTMQALTLEEHLQQQFIPTLGGKAKQILKNLGNTLISKKLYPPLPSKPMYPTVKNFYFKAHADSPYLKTCPDDLAAVEHQTEESLLDHLQHRYAQDDIYTYVGDVLLAINTKKILKLFDSKAQALYVEKARSDNPPHVFAVSDRAYQQMLHHKKSQAIICFGNSSSGKSFSSAQIINHLAFLSSTGNIAMAKKIQQLGPLLEAFGCTRASYNCNASRLLKNVRITFTKTGKITGGFINAVLLDHTRISSTPKNESNFHILYYLYEGLKSEKRLAEFGLDKLSSMCCLPQKSLRTSSELVSGYKKVCQSFKILAFTDEEILVVLRLLSAILLLGDVTYTMKGTTVTANNPYLMTSAAKNLCVDIDILSSTIGKGCSVEEVQSKKDSWMQLLYIKILSWIVSSINKQLSFSRLVLGDSFSISVVDPPGFGGIESNQMFRLSANIMNDYLQNYIQQLMFFKELEEYKEESVDVPFKYDESLSQQKTLNTLINSEKKLLNELRNSEVGGTFNWLKKLKSLPKESILVENDQAIVHHIFEKITYRTPELATANANLLSESDFIATFKNTNDTLTSTITTTSIEDHNITGQTLDKMLDFKLEDFPHLVVCLQPSVSTSNDMTIDTQCMLKQLKAFNLLEIVFIRQQGFARRLSFAEFLNRYKYLAFDFDEEVELSKENCQLLLIRLKMDGWKMGKNKVFLKYYTEEYLSRLYETHVKKIVKIQAMARRFIVKTRQRRHKG